MEGRLSKILKLLNIGLHTAQSILGKKINLNSKITEGQFRALENHVHNLSLKHKTSTSKPISAPTECLRGVPEEIYTKSAQEIKRNKAKKKRKLGKTTPKASTPQKGRAKFSDAYSLQLMKNNLAKKFEGYIYGLSDW